MAWFSNSRSLKKSQYYVWYLGSKEADGLRGNEHVLPAMRQLLRDSLRRYPNKITVQISQKGLKLIQTVPTMTKSGKLKTELIKFLIPQHGITFSMVGPAPFTDIVGVIVLVFNPETKSPVHVHCYRCDSPETATFMNANLQTILSQPDTQHRILELERRLTLTGLLTPPPEIKPSFPGDLTDLGYPPQSHHNQPQPSQNRRHQQPVAPVNERGIDVPPRLSTAHPLSAGMSRFVLDATQKPSIEGHSSESDNDDFDVNRHWMLRAAPNANNRQRQPQPNDTKTRLKKNLFYELKEKLHDKNDPVSSPEQFNRRSKSSTPEYYPKPAQQPSPIGAKDSSNTSSTSGLGSDFSSGAGAASRQSDVNNRRSRLSINDLHQAWRVQGEPMMGLPEHDNDIPVIVPRRKPRYQKAREQDQRPSVPSHNHHVEPVQMRHQPNTFKDKFSQQNKSSLELRMFGDTLAKPTPNNHEPQYRRVLPAAPDSAGGLSELKQRRRHWRSVDNLHHDLDHDMHEHHNGQLPSSITPEHNNNFNLLTPGPDHRHNNYNPHHMKPFMPSYNHHMNLPPTDTDRFWEKRAQRHSLYLPSSQVIA